MVEKAADLQLRLKVNSQYLRIDAEGVFPNRGYPTPWNPCAAPRNPRETTLRRSVGLGIGVKGDWEMTDGKKGTGD